MQITGFYSLPKEKRNTLVNKISKGLLNELKSGVAKKTISYFNSSDTYIRKSAYLSIGRLYSTNKVLQTRVIKLLDILAGHKSFNVRQAAINAAGEIGKINFKAVRHIFDKSLFDEHHSPRNAVIGSIKKMGEVNPKPVLAWAHKYIHHSDKEIRREVCHGIELRGRKYPQDILPLLKKLQHDTSPRVRNTLIHVIGQISYKNGCLKTVIEHLNLWDNKKLVAESAEEIIDVHRRYKDFAALTHSEAKLFIESNLTVSPKPNKTIVL